MTKNQKNGIQKDELQNRDMKKRKHHIHKEIKNKQLTKENNMIEVYF